MHKNLLTTLLLILVLLSSCGREERFNAQLESIDKAITDNPDSTLNLLKGMHEKTNSFSEDTRAYFNLLYVRASNESGEKCNSDSLITSVVDHYEQSKKYEHLAMAYYYAGRVSRNGQKALYYYDLAQWSDSSWLDAFWQSRILMQKGYIYQKNNLFEEAVDVQSLAKSFCKEIGDTATMRICEENISAIYSLMNASKRDSAELSTLRQNIRATSERARSKVLKLQNERLQRDNDKGNSWVWILTSAICIGGFILYFLKKTKRDAIKPTNESNSEQLLARRGFYNAEVNELLQARIKLDKALKTADWQFIEEKLLETYPEFHKQLFSLYELSDTEYHICMLIKMEITPSNMARLLAMGKSSISQARMRLQQKIFDGNGTAKDWDNYIRNL